MLNNIFTNNYTIVDKLSEGTYGIVYKVEHIESKKILLAKNLLLTIILRIVITMN